MTGEGWAGWPRLAVEEKANPEQVALEGERVEALQEEVEAAMWEGDPLVEVTM